LGHPAWPFSRAEHDWANQLLDHHPALLGILSNDVSPVSDALLNGEPKRLTVRQLGARELRVH
jgi:hypothetical protein